MVYCRRAVYTKNVYILDMLISLSNRNQYVVIISIVSLLTERIVRSVGGPLCVR